MLLFFFPTLLFILDIKKIRFTISGNVERNKDERLASFASSCHVNFSMSPETEDLNYNCKIAKRLRTFPNPEFSETD